MHVVTDLETKALSFPDQARQLAISSSSDYVQCGEFLVSIKALRKEIQNTFLPLKEKAFASHKAIVAEEKRHEEPLIEAERIVRSEMVLWSARQEEITRQREIEFNRLAREAEIEIQLQQAIAAEAGGDQAEAQAIMEEEVYVPPVILQKQTPKIQGVQFRTVWKWRVIDEKKIPREYYTRDDMKIGAVVRGLKKAGEVIPGIESYSVKV